MKLKSLMVAIVCVLAAFEPLRSGTRQGSTPLSANEAVAKLWSAREPERQKGIEQIRELGAVAAPPLVSLLTDLVHDQRPRFAPQNEPAGARALSEYLRNPESKALRAKLDALTINARLMGDAVELLGDLKSEQAVPILLEILNRSYRGRPAPEIPALRKIGSPAVPKLISDLDESHIRAIGLRFVRYGWSADERTSNNASTAPSQNQVFEPPPDSPGLSEQAWISEIRYDVALILGLIGDQAALPALRNLLASATAAGDELVEDSADTAITRIRGLKINTNNRFTPAPFKQF
ncbi:MAG TPA: hypothetical protein VEZ90_03860 [Blastocatellia bacterium]|nr:hypothetical protein [Blastocatellia bacterium]